MIKPFFEPLPEWRCALYYQLWQQTETHGLPSQKSAVVTVAWTATGAE